MVRMGFEIGLHFDPVINGDVQDSERKGKVDEKARILSNITGTDISSVSLHSPSVTGKFQLFDGFRNAYDKSIFRPERHLSDSRMRIPQVIYEFTETAREAPI